MEFDALIIGGGAAGMSCALVLGSGLDKPTFQNKKVGIVMHQKTSHLQTAVFNNVLGVKPGTTGATILKEGPEHLGRYEQVTQLQGEKVVEIEFFQNGKYTVITNKNEYYASIVVVAVGYTSLLRIKGLQDFIVPHKKAKSSKERIQLINDDHKVKEGLYVAGTLAGWRSQYAIAIGSGAAVATDILTLWNKGEHTKVHDKL